MPARSRVPTGPIKSSMDKRPFGSCSTASHACAPADIEIKCRHLSRENTGIPPLGKSFGHSAISPALGSRVCQCSGHAGRDAQDAIQSILVQVFCSIRAAWFSGIL